MVARPASGPFLVPSLTRKRAKEGDACMNSDIDSNIHSERKILKPDHHLLPKLSPRSPLSLGVSGIVQANVRERDRDRVLLYMATNSFRHILHNPT